MFNIINQINYQIDKYLFFANFFQIIVTLTSNNFNELKQYIASTSTDSSR